MLSLLITVSTIFLISHALSLLFLPSFMKPLEASIINVSVLSLSFLKIIIIVGIPVPKKILAGSPIIVSILLCSIKFFLISPSSPPLNSTPCGRTIVIIPSDFK